MRNNASNKAVMMVGGAIALIAVFYFMTNYRIVSNEDYDKLVARAAGGISPDPASAPVAAAPPPTTPPPVAAPPPQAPPPQAQGPAGAGGPRGYPTGKLVGAQNSINVSGSPVKGDKNAPITVAVFSDFQCPACSQWKQPMDSALSTYHGKVRFVFKHLPLPMHNNARIAAMASEAARLQGKFWEYHDILFQNQRALSRPDLERYAGQLGLDLTKFKKDLDSPEVRQRVDNDFQEANQLQVPGTPTFYVNGMRADIGAPYQLDTILSEAVNKKK